MEFSPRALLVTVVFLVMLWIAVEGRYGVIAFVLDAVLGIGLWMILPEDWPRLRRAPVQSVDARRRSR